MNSVRTDNVFINIILSTIIVAVIGALTTNISLLIIQISNFIKKCFTSGKYQIEINYEYHYNKCGEIITDKVNGHNYMLIQSILNEISKHNYDCKLANVSMHKPKEGQETGVTLKEQMLHQHMNLKPLDRVTCNYICKKGNKHKIMIIYEKVVDIEKSDDPAKHTKIILTLESKSSTMIIKEFAQYCYEIYIKETYEGDTEHHYYVMNRASDNYLYFLRYALNNTKQLSHMFLPEIDEIVKLIDDFKNKTGSFLIPGVQHKLGFLLYGPPGTGKTTFIKALANDTGRSVINIRLNTIDNASQLIDIMFGLNIPTLYRNERRVPLNKRIYVFEDIDAMSSIIEKRSEKYKDKIEEDSKKSDLEKIFDKYEKKKLTLSDILNIFDGVLELDNVIIVMTTNHIEKLDPALIRYGRISMKICMDYMRIPEIKKLIYHYFGEIPDLSEIEDGVLTPATIESYCQRSNNVDEVVEKMNKN